MGTTGNEAWSLPFAAWLMWAHVSDTTVLAHPSDPIAHEAGMHGQVETSSSPHGSPAQPLTPSGAFSRLYAVGAMNEQGLSTQVLGPIVAPATPVLSTSTSAHGHRTTSRVALVLKLFSAGGHPPWTAREAILVTPSGRRVRELLVWQSRPLGDKDTEVILVLETEAKPQELRGHYLLELREGATSPPLHLGPVSFPMI